MDSIPDVELRLVASPANVAVVRHVLGGAGEALGMDEEALGNLRLAVSEACTNVVIHAYSGGPPGGLEVTATADGDLLHIAVRDEGGGFAPRPDSPGLGMGLPLIAAVTRSMEVGTTAGGGNELRMTFLVRSAAGAEGPR